MSSVASSKGALRACQFISSATQKRSLSSHCSKPSFIRLQQWQRPSLRRNESTNATDVPSNPKIASIVDEISTLTLLETADLVATLKSRLNIPDMSFAAPATASAPGAAAAAPVEEEAAPPVQEKTLFTLKLKSFDAAAKPKVIKEVKSMLGLSLVDSKKFVESVPKVMKEGVPKEDAEKIVATLKALGGVVDME